jgi:hypothetical protein
LDQRLATSARLMLEVVTMVWNYLQDLSDFYSYHLVYVGEPGVVRGLDSGGPAGIRGKIKPLAGVSFIIAPITFDETFKLSKEIFNWFPAFLC